MPIPDARRLTEIREAGGKNAGEWQVHRYNHVHGELWLGIGHDGRGPIADLCSKVVEGKPPCWHPVAELKHLVASDAEQKANADFIAHAPADIRDLLEERERVREALEAAHRILVGLASVDMQTRSANYDRHRELAEWRLEAIRDKKLTEAALKPEAVRP